MASAQVHEDVFAEDAWIKTFGAIIRAASAKLGQLVQKPSSLAEFSGLEVLLGDLPEKRRAQREPAQSQGAGLFTRKPAARLRRVNGQEILEQALDFGDGRGRGLADWEHLRDRVG